MKKNKEILDVSEKISGILQAVSPPARLAILLVIGRGEACVCHLESALGWRQAYISQHLMALRKAEILLDRRDGRYIYYRLADTSLMDVVLAAAQLSGLDAQTITPIINTRKNPSCECPQCTSNLVPSKNP
jgi:DNA-binding transcriptional ArsR family regulator